MSICVSIVSHGHGSMVATLVGQLLLCPEVTRVVVTFNVPEPRFDCPDSRLLCMTNASPKGFGANHNAAFAYCESDAFCVLNPDIELVGNPFPVLLPLLDRISAGVVAPCVVGPDFKPEDSMRRFLTPVSFVKRLLGLDAGVCGGSAEGVGEATLCYPDWVGGMFMLFKAATYKNLRGFDEGYFMYCEDADLCTRLWQTGRTVVGCRDVSVIHRARRASLHDARHFRWHIGSLLRYWRKHLGRLHRYQVSGFR